MGKNQSRRNFIKSITCAAGFTAVPFVPASVLGKNGHVAPSEKLAIGCIGVGPQGTHDMRGFLAQEDARVVAVCDVKSDRLEMARNTVNEKYGSDDCATYKDYRDVLARQDIDVVLIATPDHWHVPIALDAARAGKDMYVEKPLGLSVYEDQMLRQAIHQYDRIFQFGTQQRSNANFRSACELVQNGFIGELKRINVWSPASVPGGPDTPATPPETVDYDFWLGPAAKTPYTEFKCSDNFRKKTWWFNSDYALGFIAGWGIHPMDIAIWGGAGYLDGPIEVEGHGVFPVDGACDTATDWQIDLRFQSGVVIDFRGMAVENNAESVWNQSMWAERYKRTTSHGTAFEGSDGWVHVDRVGLNANPASLLKKRLAPTDKHLYASQNHVRNLLDSVRTRRQSICPIDVSVQGDIFCHIADIAARTGEKLNWDQQLERFTNSEKANRYLVRAWRV